MFRLRFPERRISHWAVRFLDSGDKMIENRIGPSARARGYLTRAEFLQICRWKTPRSRPLCVLNSALFVREVTHEALSTRDDELKMRTLLRLSGVGLPTASVILHFCDRRKYPILDVRVLWSLGITKPPSFTIPFWLKYTEFLRGLADRTKQDMRTLDRALWQYSRENQPRRSRGTNLQPNPPL